MVEDIFLRGDLVKFAKTIPSQELMTKDFDEIRDFVRRSTKDVEAEHLRNMNIQESQDNSNLRKF